MSALDLDALEPAEALARLAHFLHDPAAIAPVEPFAALLAALIHRRETNLWDLLGRDPGPFLAALPQERPACMACASFPLCQGYGAFRGSCATWREVLPALARAARELRALKTDPSRRGRHAHTS
jgi:hypothetical protein